MVGAVLTLAAACLLAAAPAAACSLVPAGPALGQSWPERRQELIARNGFARPAATALLHAPVPRKLPNCGGAAPADRHVRHRLGLIAPTWQRYGPFIAASAARHGVPAELILAAIVEESGGRADAVATFPGYVSDAVTPDKISLGLGQVLLSTARRIAPERNIGRAALFDPAVSTDLVARYFAHFYGLTGFDPRLAGSAYNAGSLRRVAPGQSWSPPNPRYVARFVAVFEASVAHLAAQPHPPPVSFAALLAE